jgi:hypothetical protein
MTGICYFTEKSTEYLAEMQVDAFVRYTEDDVVTLKMEGNFTPEKADALIERAISDNCEKLVFITENKNVDILNRLLPQEYGKYFENISVFEENYDRLNEAGEQQTAAQPQQAPAQGQAPATQNAEDDVDKVVIVCNAAAPNAQTLKAFINDRAQLVSKGILTQEQLNSSKTWFVNVDSAGLTASGIKTLYEQHPNDAVKQAINNLGVSNEGFDTNIENLVMMAKSSNTVQKGHSYIFVVPQNLNIQSEPNSPVVIKAGGLGNYENPNNKQILPLITEVAKMAQNPKAEVSKRSDLPESEEEFTKAFNKEENNIKFIIAYAKSFEWWTKNKDKRLKTKEAENQLAKAVKDFLLADLNNAWNALKNDKDKGISFLANSVDNIRKAIKADKEKNKDKTNSDKVSKQDETVSRNLFSWVNYTQLCKLLGLK